jgi:hypothetical protein
VRCAAGVLAVAALLAFLAVWRSWRCGSASRCERL